jgi:hypothetical protein
MTLPSEGRWLKVKTISLVFPIFLPLALGCPQGLQNEDLQTARFLHGAAGGGAFDVFLFLHSSLVRNSVVSCDDLGKVTMLRSGSWW